jgi:uroporphyrinogen decarboxylase
VLGLDWRTPIATARGVWATQLVVQGNLDPALVLAGPTSRSPAWRPCSPTTNGGTPGHIFNLGHGVQPDTDPEVLARRGRPSARAPPRPRTTVTEIAP